MYLMQRYKNLKVMLAFTLVIGSLSLLNGCGGGGSSNGSSTTPVTTGSSSSMISGAAIKGPVAGATVTAYGITNGVIGSQVAAGTTDSMGNFTISIGAYSGPVMLQLSNGTYIDEATGATMTMAPGDVMTALMTTLPTGTTVSGIQVTPLTSMAQAMANNMAGGMTDANIIAANTAIGNYFMVNDILHTPPMNPLASSSSSAATQDMRYYGMAIAAMTQYAKNIGMITSSGIVTLMMNDASDGVLNGMMGNTQIAVGGMGGMMGGGTMMQSTAGTTGLANALTQFMGSGMNQSGLTLSDMQTLMDRFGSSNGQLLGNGGMVTGGTGTGGMVTGGTGTGGMVTGGTGTGGMVTGGTGTGGMMSGLIIGRAFNGTMVGGTVMAVAINNGMTGAQLASGMTDSQGNFTMSLGNYSGPVMLQMNGGSYTDLATGAAMTMTMVNVMTAIIPSISAGATITGIQLTPLTSMAQARAQNTAGGMTDANIIAANTAVGNYFMVSDILQTQPMNPLISGSGTNATEDMKNYGITIAAMSQYAKNIGMTNSSGIITSMMNDASDGIMNGKIGNTQITMTGMNGGGMMGGGTMMSSTAGTSGLATAMTTFINNTAINKSGLTTTDMQLLINTLSASNGTI
jgi:hypothetical protein